MSVSLRMFVYDRVIEHGQIPTANDIGGHLGVSPDEVRRILKATRIGKTLLPDPETGELWMIGPFSAAPTPYRVRAGNRSWWANCAWDALGIASIIAEPVDIDAQCQECGEAMPMHVNPGDRSIGDGVVHFLVPAKRWYENIGFT